IWHYSKGDKFIGNQVRIDKPEKTKRALRKKVDGKTLNVLDENGSKIYVEYSDKIIDDVWQIGRTISKDEYVDYPTQKKEDLITRLLEYGSNPNDIVLDCFIGSGTTAAVAQKLGRRWIGCDINKGAIQTTSKRLQKIIIEQIEEEKKKHPELFTEKSPSPQGEVQRVRSFAHYKVNDYDLQLLRTEAIELAVQHLGIQRSKTETFFDGTLGKTLVKLIDFNHPLTLLDLQQIQDELKKRPKEQRDITVVCLGRELTTEPWVEEYNKKHPVNKLQIIELRTDSKYGKFLIHQPAVANVEITRFSKEKKCKVEIKDFISPTILERLNLDENLFKVKIPDFRSMIDVVLIDNNYDGSLFNIAYSDVPEKKNDLINGTYEIDLTNKDSKIAIKIIDMLGEEVLIVK
ncbi:MAG: site-specific DNA-methyltransferase, partial [Ignavibacteria bacterium]|nr:site-specific DNA-methyltransferase [Ignavibacteria bacterium]